MMRLIDADVLIAEICQDQCERKYCDCDYTCSVVAPIVNAPTIPAVPLDKLCEWLAAWDIQVIPCNVCKSVFHLESCPHGPFDCGDSEHLKMLIKKWMEGLDDHE